MGVPNGIDGIRETALSYGEMLFTTVYSEHDGGWHSEVWSDKTGVDLHETDVYATYDEAKAAAKRWMKTGNEREGL